ncbi:MAG: hypothetical protein ACXWJK_12970 [Burkholderiaceae bacterium]
MTPSLSIPTDNIYKFACLFGLALIISTIFAFVSTYTTSLESKIKYTATIISLEAKEQRSKAENDLLVMDKQLIEVTKTNEKFADSAIGVVFGIGFILSIYGAIRWYNNIQMRDDKLGVLQLEKLEIEIAKLRSELDKSSSEKPPES